MFELTFEVINLLVMNLAGNLLPMYGTIFSVISFVGLSLSLSKQKAYIIYQILREETNVFS